MTTNTINHICDRCFDSIELPDTYSGPYPRDWQYVTLSQTGASLDLCDGCNKELVMFLEAKGSSNMEEACINKREVL